MGERLVDEEKEKERGVVKKRNTEWWMKHRTKQRRKAIKDHSVVLYLPVEAITRVINHQKNPTHTSPPKIIAGNTNTHKHTRESWSMSTHRLIRRNIQTVVVLVHIWTHKRTLQYMHTYWHKHHQYAIIVLQLLSLQFGVYWLWPEGPIKKHQLYHPKGKTHRHTPTHTHTHNSHPSSLL